MTAHPYWISHQLAIVPRPRGGDRLDDEMLALRAAGIDVVVSMLEIDEADNLGLLWECDAAERAGISFINFPVPDGSVPHDLDAFLKFLAGLERLIEAGGRVGVHCRACIGRSSVVTTSLLIRAGFPSDEAWSVVGAARRYPVPDTAEQAFWVNLHIKADPS